MQTPAVVVRVFLALVALLPVAAISAAEVDAHAADRQALRLVLAEIEAGINARDLPRLLAPLDDDVIVTYQNAHVARGKAEVEAYYKQMLESPNALVERLQIRAEVGGPAVFHDQVAIAHGTSVDHMRLRTGQEIELDAAWSSTSVRKGKAWKVVAIHFSTNVLDNSLLRAAQRMAFWVGGLGLLAGLAAGFWLGRRRRVK